ncbi:hypothetical protein ABKN59_009030 [Abortiporus biennis]
MDSADATLNIWSKTNSNLKIEMQIFYCQLWDSVRKIAIESSFKLPDSVTHLTVPKFYTPRILMVLKLKFGYQNPNSLRFTVPGREWRPHLMTIDDLELVLKGVRIMTVIHRSKALPLIVSSNLSHHPISWCQCSPPLVHKDRRAHMATQEKGEPISIYMHNPNAYQAICHVTRERSCKLFSMSGRTPRSGTLLVKKGGGPPVRPSPYATHFVIIILLNPAVAPPTQHVFDLILFKLPDSDISGWSRLSCSGIKELESMLLGGRFHISFSVNRLLSESQASSNSASVQIWTTRRRSSSILNDIDIDTKFKSLGSGPHHHRGFRRLNEPTDDHSLLYILMFNVLPSILLSSRTSSQKEFQSTMKRI